MHAVESTRERSPDAPGRDEGFTLIELLVVLLIIGILLAIAIPTFLSVTNKANNTAAQSNLSTALTGADAFFANAGQQSYANLDYTAGATSTISSIGTGITYVSGSVASSSSTGPKVISIWVPASSGGAALVMTALARGSLDCWGIVDIKATLSTAIDHESAPGTYYFVVPGSSVSTCIAASVTPTVANISSTAYPHG